MFTSLELTFLVCATLIAWPLISDFFKAIGYRIATLFWSSGYPVKFTLPTGKVKTYYLNTASDVIEFNSDPLSFIESHQLNIKK